MANYLEGKLQDNADKAILIAYHCNVDPKPYEDDSLATNETRDRLKYYGFTYVPYARLNGLSPGGSSSAYSVTDSKIQSEYQKEPVFSFEIVGSITGTDPHTCDITVTATALKDYSSNGGLNLFAIVVENDIDFKTVYGVNAKNGKNDYNHVVRKFLTSTGGTTIGNQDIGKVNTFNFSYENVTKYQNYENLRVIVFIQDMGTKDILGVFETEDHPFQTPTGNNNLAISNTGNKIAVKQIGQNKLSLFNPAGGEVSVALYTLDGKCIKEYNLKDCCGNVILTLPQQMIGTGGFIVTVNNGKETQSKLFVLVK